MTFTVHTDLPLPKRQRATAAKYPFHLLQEPGHSFLDEDVVDVKKAVARLTAAVGSYRRRQGAGAPKFAVRTLTQPTGVDVVGVWRL